MVNVMVILTKDQKRVVCLKNFPLVLPLGVYCLLVLISVGVASSLRSQRALLIVASLSMISFRLFFPFFLTMLGG